MLKVKGKGGHPAMQKHNRGTKFTNWKRSQSSFPSGKQIGMIIAAFRFLHQKFAKFHSVSSRNFLNAKHYYPKSAQQGTYAMNECIF
jgi:hypothetical protein